MAHSRPRRRTFVQVQVPPPTREALRAAAMQRDLTVSQLVRRGMRLVLAESNEAAAPGEKGDGSEDVARPGASRDLR